MLTGRNFRNSSAVLEIEASGDDGSGVFRHCVSLPVGHGFTGIVASACHHREPFMELGATLYSRTQKYLADFDVHPG